jgi:hypothetical protein
MGNRANTIGKHVCVVTTGFDNGYRSEEVASVLGVSERYSVLCVLTKGAEAGAAL